MNDNRLTYSLNGDYLLPDLILDEPPELAEPLGRYARIRKAYLKENRTMTYNTMLLKETLFPHLRETEELATARLKQVMKILMSRDSLPDKADDPMGWTAAMNALKAQAEELVLNELVYA
ncbi:MAG: TnpV protein [Oscillospiraceae bacterium]|nr:TnpV protein [Oscillospiraceae bacterium]